LAVPEFCIEIAGGKFDHSAPDCHPPFPQYTRGNGVVGSRPDNIIYDITNASGFQIGTSASGFGHAQCTPDNGSLTDARGLPAVE
jgi:hypothetical protein